MTILVGSQITITDAVSITGLGAANLKLNGGTVNQILNINLATSANTAIADRLPS
jgi:hypothetical protein